MMKVQSHLMLLRYKLAFCAIKSIPNLITSIWITIAHNKDSFKLWGLSYDLKWQKHIFSRVSSTVIKLKTRISILGLKILFIFQSIYSLYLSGQVILGILLPTFILFPTSTTSLGLLSSFNHKTSKIQNLVVTEALSSPANPLSFKSRINQLPLSSIFSSTIEHLGFSLRGVHLNKR